MAASGVVEDGTWESLAVETLSLGGAADAAGQGPQAAVDSSGAAPAAAGDET